MGLFDNTKVKKSISVVLASISLFGASGCKKDEKKDTDKISNNNIENKNDFDFEETYNDAFEEMGVEVKDEKNLINENESVPTAKPNMTSQVENDLKKDISGITERERLIRILDEKEWGATEEALVLEMFDIVDNNYDLRELNDSREKQNYIRNMVNTIDSISSIVIDPNDSVLAQKGWIARADYNNNKIVMKFNNPTNLRHEIAHMEPGTFLNGTNGGVDLGYVFEEGRASYIEADAMKNSQWIDNISMDLDLDENEDYIVNNCSGTYPVFEEVYKNFMRLGINLEKIRRQDMSVSMFTDKIESQLNSMYGQQLGSQYINAVNSYIKFFNKHGALELDQNQQGQTAEDVRDIMNSIQAQCMAQNRANQMKRDVGMER